MMIFVFIILAVFINVPRAIYGLKISGNSIEGTETLKGLTDKQLAIQRWFADLTFLRENINDWNGWGKSVENVDCDGNTCIRYEIAGLAYAAAVLGLKTPLYKQVAESIMYNAIVRMTEQVVWQYIELFDDFKDQSTYPDPVAYKNIMYSGHLVQMMALFEAVFQNNTFSTSGWDFHWKDPITFEETILHYNMSLLMDRVYQQSLVYEIGGVPCEPDSIFVICNNYPQNGWLLYDQLYATNYTADSIPSWYRTISTHGINRVLRDVMNNYFKLDYLIRPLGIWEPIGNIGSDLWALGWMKPWWPQSDINGTLQAAFESIASSSCWTTVNETTAVSADGALVPYSYLHVDENRQKIFPFDDMITTSFYPMIEKQFLNRSQSDQKQIYSQVLNYFESLYGQSIDVNCDGSIDAYRYNSVQCNTSECEVGDYSIWATANLLIGMIHPNDDIDFLRRFFQLGVKELQAKRKNTPLVESVEYPNVMVASITFTENLSNRNLTLVVKPGDIAPVNRYHQVIISNLPQVVVRSLKITVDGIELTNYEKEMYEPGGTMKLILQVPGWNSDDAIESKDVNIEILY